LRDPRERTGRRLYKLAARSDSPRVQVSPAISRDPSEAGKPWGPPQGIAVLLGRGLVIDLAGP